MIVELVILTLFVFTCQNEYVKYHHAFLDCTKQQRSDIELLSRDVCFNYEDRLMFEHSVDCSGAEKRLRVSTMACAMQKWFHASSLMHIYNTLMTSYLTMFLTIMTPILFAMYLWKSKATELAIVDKMGKIMKKSRKSTKWDKNTAVCYR